MSELAPCGMCGAPWAQMCQEKDGRIAELEQELEIMSRLGPRLYKAERENERLTRAWLKIREREIETDKNIDELRTEANELIDALRSEVSALEIENTSLMAARMEALEIYAGMEGFESKTAPEAYCQRIIEQMAKALLVHEEV